MEWCLDREGESGSYVFMGMECLFCKRTVFLERNTADWHMRMWMDLVPLTCTLGIRNYFATI